VQEGGENDRRGGEALSLFIKLPSSGNWAISGFLFSIVLRVGTEKGVPCSAGREGLGGSFEHPVLVGKTTRTFLRRVELSDSWRHVRSLSTSKIGEQGSRGKKKLLKKGGEGGKKGGARMKCSEGMSTISSVGVLSPVACSRKNMLEKRSFAPAMNLRQEG